MTKKEISEVNNENVSEKMKICNCKKWEVGEPQLRSFTSLAWTHGLYYTGATFSFCPWCGKKLKEIKAIAINRIFIP